MCKSGARATYIQIFVTCHGYRPELHCIFSILMELDPIDTDL
jgi:hypothetical protein